jgi:hypothetical protein
MLKTIDMYLPVKQVPQSDDFHEKQIFNKNMVFLSKSPSLFTLFRCPLFLISENTFYIRETALRVFHWTLEPKALILQRDREELFRENEISNGGGTVFTR